MSRSYKKTPYCGLKKSKFFKRLSNRKIRKSKKILTKKELQSFVNSYDICDYKELSSYKSFLKKFQNGYYDDLSFEEALNDWKGTYLRK